MCAYLCTLVSHSHSICVWAGKVPTFPTFPTHTQKKSSDLEIFKTSVPMQYVSMFLRTHPHEQNH